MWFRNKPKRYSRRLVIEQLEERIVLDAAVPVTPHDGAHHHLDHHAEHNLSDNTGLTAGWNSGDQGVTNAVSGSWASSGNQTGPSHTSHQHGLDIVLISSSLDNVSTLSGAVGHNATVIVYDGQNETINELVSSLTSLVQSSGEKIEHLAILSHGQPGVFELSDQADFSASTVSSNPGPWQTLGTLMGAHARIDFYGCDTGAGSDGVKLVDTVAATTGATVWASDHVVGSAAGASWVLDVESGPSKMKPLINGNALNGTDITLAGSPITNGNFATGDYTGWTLSTTVDTTTYGNAYYFGATTIDHTGTAISSGQSVTDYSSGKPVYIYDAGLPTTLVPPKNATYAALMLDNGPVDMQMSQNITLPATAQTISWEMDYNNMSPTGFTATQYLTINIENATTGAVLDSLVSTNSRTALSTNGWLTCVYNISAYAGQTVKLSIELSAKDYFFDAAFANFSLNAPWAYSQTATAIENIPTMVALGANDAQTPALAMTYYIDSLPANGALYATLANATAKTNPLTVGAALASNQVYYVTSVNNPADTSFNFHVVDTGGNTSASAVESINVGPVAAAPVAENGSITVIKNGVYTGYLYGTDSADPAVSSVYFTVTQGANGTVALVGGTLTTDGHGDYQEEYTFTPKTGFTGSTNFTYTFNTPMGGSTFNGFSAGTAVGAATTNSTLALQVVDLNDNGLLDIVTGNGNLSTGAGQASYIYWQNSGGGFTGAVETQIGSSSYAVSANSTGYLANINNDGNTDLVVRNYNGPDMYYLWVPGSGTTGHYDSGHQLANSTGGTWGGVGVGDIYGNGLDDIVEVKNNNQVYVYKNLGNGTFDSGTLIPVTTGGTISTVCVADMNGDGKPDIILGISGGTGDQILYNDGNGNFTTSYTLPGSGRNPQIIAVGDITGNGLMDIVEANDGSASRLYMNNGNGTFTASNIGTSADSGGISLVDLTGSGILDVVVSNYNGNANGTGAGVAQMYYLFQTGTDTFDAGHKVGTTVLNGFGSAAGDMNNDGAPDFVVGQLAGQPYIFYSLGTASPAATVSVTVNLTGLAAVMGPMDAGTSMDSLDTAGTSAPASDSSPASTTTSSTDPGVITTGTSTDPLTGTSSDLLLST